MKKAVRLVLSLFSALSLMFLSCSTDSSGGGGSSPEFDVIVCDTKGSEKSDWERKSTEQVYICITSTNYLTDLEVKNVYYTDELEDISFYVVDKYVETAGVYRINLNSFTTKAGSYNCTVVVASKSNPDKKTTINFTVKITGSSSQDEVAVPEITKQPAAGKEYYGHDENIDALKVEATISSKEDIAYQWYKDDNPVSDATSASYTPTEKGVYYVRVSNASDSAKYVNSDKVSIIVLAEGDLVPPSITKDLPETISYDKTSDIEALEISATAKEGNVAYQWYKDDSPVSGATSASYKPDAFGSYYCEVWAVSGEKKSQKVISKIVEIKESDISIEISGLADEAYLGDTLSVNAIINVEVTSIEYQWYKSGAISSGSDEIIDGATSASYTPTEEGNYKCKITVTSKGGNTKVADNSGTCTVKEKRPDDPATPVITSKPSDVTVTEGEKIELSVVANVTDGGKLSYQWKKNGQALSGATSATYSIAKAATTDSGTYTVVVTNTLNEKTATAEASATVTVSSGTGGATGGFDFLK